MSGHHKWSDIKHKGKHKSNPLDAETDSISSPSPVAIDAQDGKSDEDVKSGHPGYFAALKELEELHSLKSGGYGDSSDPFFNFSVIADMTSQPRYLYPVMRSIEKLARVLSLHAQGRTGELEEEFLDVASLNVCATAMLREDVQSDER